MKPAKPKMFTWIDGRQGSGYKVMYLWFKWFDLVLIRYPLGSYIDWHKDPVPAGLEHHRVNITVRRAEGGRFMIKYDETNRGTPWGGVYPECAIYPMRVVRFRPDLQIHGVEKVTAGERWVISIGWVKKRVIDAV